MPQCLITNRTICYNNEQNWNVSLNSPYKIDGLKYSLKYNKLKTTLMWA